MKYLMLLAALSLSGCAGKSFKDFIGTGVGSTADQNTVIGSDPRQCAAIRNQCVGGGHYNEWETKEGKFGCSCVQQ